MANTLQEVLEQLEQMEHSENFDAEKYRELVEQAEMLKQQEELRRKVQELKQWANTPATSPVMWSKSQDPEPPVDEKSWIEVDGKKYALPLAIMQKGYKSAFEAYMLKGKEHLGPEDRKTLQAGIDSSGGFLVPEDIMAQLLKRIAARSVVRSRARVVTTSRDSITAPFLNYSADDKYTSNVRMNWLGETPANATDHRVNDTDMFAMKKVEVHNAYSSVLVSEDLLSDSAFNIASLLVELFGENFAVGEDEAFTTGDGVRKPRGIVQETEIPTVNSGNASALTADGLLDLFYALPAQYRVSAIWVMNSGTLKAIEKFKDSQGRYLVSSLLNSSLATPEADTLKGKPVLINEFMPDVAANALPIVFGDMSGYMIVDRVGISIQRLSELYAEYNSVLFLCRKRVGGMVVEPWKFRFQKVAS